MVVMSRRLKGRAGQDVDVVAPALQRWVYEIAGMREHGTTHRRPLEVFRNVEQAVPKPLPAHRFEMVVWKEATVDRDCHVIFDHRLYAERDPSREYGTIPAEPWVPVEARSADEPPSERPGAATSDQRACPPWSHRATGPEG